MSPEQAQGQTVDKRTDIWAFGCVLCEMLTEQSAFPGKTVTEIIAAVIRAEPDWNNLPENLHWRLREVRERCLKKELRCLHPIFIRLPDLAVYPEVTAMDEGLHYGRPYRGVKGNHHSILACLY
jgi:serine/threonine protein kinase